MIKLKRFKGNPIIEPIPNHPWEAKATFNPAAVYEGGKVHIVYRAMSEDNTSVLGYASSKDGFHIDERLSEPIYVPREEFEMKAQPGLSGCEDPRITKIGERFYMCYTAFDAKNPTRVALTSIKVEDFLNHNWNWGKPVLISPPGINDKNACILPERVDEKYVIFHRIEPCIWVDFVDDLIFEENEWINGNAWFRPRTDSWDSKKIGIAGPPIKMKTEWLMLYHGVSELDRKYRVGAILLESKDPAQAMARTDEPLLEPEMDYEKEGQVGNVVFPCGAVVIDNDLFVYYGGGDRVVAVATMNFFKLEEELLASREIDTKDG